MILGKYWSNRIRRDHTGLEKYLDELRREFRRHLDEVSFYSRYSADKSIFSGL